MNSQPSFDTWTTIFLFAAVQGFFVSIVLIFQNAEKNKSKMLLAIIALLFSVTLLEYVLYWTRYLYYVPHLSNLSAGFPFLYGPLIYYYFRSVFENYKPGKRDLYAFIPFIAYLVYGGRYYLLSAAVKQKFMLATDGNGGGFPLMPWLQIIAMFIYLAIVIRKYYALSSTNPETIIRFMLNKTQHIKLSVYSVTGEVVEELFEGAKEGGSHQVSFSAAGMPSGVYIYRLITKTGSFSEKMCLVR